MTLQNDKKQNISLIIGLSIPIAMILFIAIAINGPRWFNTVTPPRNDFLYTTGQQDPNSIYRVKDGRLIIQEKLLPEGVNTTPLPALHFFVHDVSENTSLEVSENRAMKLALNGSLRSPDGFSIETGRSGGWFPFGYGRNYKNRYLMKESYSEKLKLETQNSGHNYYWSFHFLGWVATDE